MGSPPIIAKAGAIFMILSLPEVIREAIWDALMHQGLREVSGTEHKVLRNFSGVGGELEGSWHISRPKHSSRRSSQVLEFLFIQARPEEEPGPPGLHS